MNYPLMTPTFEMKPFEEMTKKEAQIHFNWYLSEVPKRIELLSNAFLETGGGTSGDLDFSQKSLMNLWSWFIPRITTITKSDDEIASELKVAPEWFKEKIIENNKKLSIGTLSLAMDIAIYLAEVFIKNFNSLEWGFVTHPKSLAYVNSPVVIGFSSGVELDPRNLVYNLTLKTVNGELNEKGLFNLFDAWKDDI